MWKLILPLLSRIVMREKFSHALQVRLSCAVQSIVDSKIVAYSVMLYLCHILFEFSVVTHTAHASFAVPWHAFVFVVLLTCGLTKIFNLVVKFVSIYVVNKQLRESTMFNQPNQSVSSILFPRQLDVPVTVGGYAASNRTNGYF